MAKLTSAQMVDRNSRIMDWLARDKEKYCWMHPSIHPDNKKKTEWKDGKVIKYKGVVDRTIVGVEYFKYCPTCFCSKPKEDVLKKS